MTEQMHIGDAVHQLRYGRKMARDAWSMEGVPASPFDLRYVILLAPVAAMDVLRAAGGGLPINFKTCPDVAVMVFQRNGESAPWAPSQADLLARDWYEFPYSG